MLTTGMFLLYRMYIVNLYGEFDLSHVAVNTVLIVLNAVIIKCAWSNLFIFALTHL